VSLLKNDLILFEPIEIQYKSLFKKSKVINHKKEIKKKLICIVKKKTNKKQISFVLRLPICTFFLRKE